jgi:hypothetical protein
LNSGLEAEFAVLPSQQLGAVVGVGVEALKGGEG